MAFADRIRDYQARVEGALDRWLPPVDSPPDSLHAAMRYSVLGGGKRIRPILVYASGEAFGVEAAALDGPACAVEMIHTYSLIHDDLPAMDDDDLRRGRPTCHRAFDEATAILAGDALQALAFHVLAEDSAIAVEPERRLRMINVLAVASGSRGMAGGQAIDLKAAGRALSLAELEGMHRLKTGALISASVELGALASPRVAPADLERLCTYARHIGLAFQIQDDILDIECDTDTLGKPQGSDLLQDKATYPRLLGLEGARKAARESCEKALAAVADLGDGAEGLRWLAEYIVNRRN